MWSWPFSPEDLDGQHGSACLASAGARRRGLSAWIFFQTPSCSRLLSHLLERGFLSGYPERAVADSGCPPVFPPGGKWSRRFCVCPDLPGSALDLQHLVGAQHLLDQHQQVSHHRGAGCRLAMQNGSPYGPASATLWEWSPVLGTQALCTLALCWRLSHCCLDSVARGTALGGGYFSFPTFSVLRGWWQGFSGRGESGGGSRPRAGSTTESGSLSEFCLLPHQTPLLARVGFTPKDNGRLSTANM